MFTDILSLPNEVLLIELRDDEHGLVCLVQAVERTGQSDIAPSSSSKPFEVLFHGVEAYLVTSELVDAIANVREKGELPLFECYPSKLKELLGVAEVLNESKHFVLVTSHFVVNVLGRSVSVAR